MNGSVSLGQPVTIEVNYDPPSDFIAMTVFDGIGNQIGSKIAMTNVVGDLYIANYTPLIAQNYIFRKAVYTDGTYTTLDNNYAQASESIQVSASADLTAVLARLTAIADGLANLSNNAAYITQVNGLAAFLGNANGLVATVTEVTNLVAFMVC